MATSPANALLHSPTLSDSDPPHSITLDQLVNHFLAAKNSLLSTCHVSRAQEIVSLARDALEENAVRFARNSFARSIVDQQIESLEALRYGGNLVDAECQGDFEATIQSLDQIDHRLKSTLQTLRSTPVEPSFRPADEERKFLFDFIDESGVEDLYASIKASIDRYDVARSTFTDVCEEFDTELDRINASLSESAPDSLDKQHFDNPQETPIPRLFASLENHANEVAEHLVGLAKHYDLCITALRHTDGGGEAINQASESAQAGSAPTADLAGLGLDLGEFGGRSETENLEPLGEEERIAMLAVIDKDAVEVDEVVAEIRDTLTEMEDQLSHVTSYVSYLRDSSDRLRSVIASIKGIVSKTPEYVAAAVTFQEVWQTEKRGLNETREDVAGTTNIFAGFHHAYDGLIVEVQRRRHVQAKVNKMVRSTMREIDRLYEEDAAEREAFRVDQAEYLPSDIWPGLLHAPPRYDLVNVEEGAEPLPELAKGVFDAARQRILARTQR